MAAIFGFNSDMLGLITAAYVIDSFITGCNVAENGAFAIIFDKMSSCIRKISQTMVE